MMENMQSRLAFLWHTNRPLVVAAVLGDLVLLMILVTVLATVL